jgi:2-polyprenyl-3-methyl-5-hydroxy-6-metoxy-1,4-benzoquinol methylase
VPGSITEPEQYGESYYETDHKRWFEHPNIALFKRIAAFIPPEASVLDVGCGRGDFLRFLRKTRRDLRLTGIDLSLNEDAEGIRFFRGDIFHSGIGGPFDVVVSLAVVEHVQDVTGFVARLRELTKPGGTVAAMTLNDSSLLYALARAGRSIGVPLAFNRLYSKHHLHHFTRRSLRVLFVRNGYSIRSAFDHNSPLQAVDIPVQGRLTDAVLRSGLWLLWRAGDVTRRRYLQTIVCRSPGNATIATSQ